MTRAVVLAAVAFLGAAGTAHAQSAWHARQDMLQMDQLDELQKQSRSMEERNRLERERLEIERKRFEIEEERRRSGEAYAGTLAEVTAAAERDRENARLETEARRWTAITETKEGKVLSLDFGSVIVAGSARRFESRVDDRAPISWLADCRSKIATSLLDGASFPLKKGTAGRAVLEAACKVTAVAPSAVSSLQPQQR